MQIRSGGSVTPPRAGFGPHDIKRRDIPTSEMRRLVTHNATCRQAELVSYKTNYHIAFNNIYYYGNINQQTSVKSNNLIYVPNCGMYDRTRPNSLAQNLLHHNTIFQTTDCSLKRVSKGDISCIKD